MENSYIKKNVIVDSYISILYYFINVLFNDGINKIIIIYIYKV